MSDPVPNAKDRVRDWLDAYYVTGGNRKYNGNIMLMGDIVLTAADLEVLVQTIDTLTAILVASGLASTKDYEIRHAADKLLGEA